MKATVRHIIDAVRSALLPKIEGIHSDTIFRDILKHERAVAERNSHYVTVLAFYSDEKRIGFKTARILGGIFADRLRATDLIGWLDARTIGVILPQTRVKDGSLVAEHVCRKMAAHGVKLDYKFYLYPHEECGKWDKDRELPLSRNCDCSPSSRTGHEQMPLDPDVGASLGEAAYKRGQFEWAARLLQESAAGGSRQADAYYYLGMSYHQLKNKAAARKALNKALELDPRAEWAPVARERLAHNTVSGGNL